MRNTSSAVRGRRGSRRKTAVAIITVGGAAVLAATVLSLASSASTLPTTLKVTQNASWGPTLTLKNGDTVYAFAKDTKNKSNCTGQCAVDWPPVILTTGQKAPDGVGVKGLGEIMRANGTHQVTYEGIPLYRFVGDKAPGQVNGNITAFGGRWRSVNPASPHTPPMETSGTSSSSGSGSTGASGPSGGTGSTGGSVSTTTTTSPPSSGISY